MKLTRKELYDLVWEEPMTTITKNLDKNIDLSVYNGYTFNPITVFSLTGTEKSQTFIPSKSEQDAYANKILDKNPSQNEAFISDGKGITYNSHRELNLIGTGNMGINLDKVISGKSYREQEMTKKNGLIYSFSHKLFTLSMDLEEHIVKEKINKKIFLIIVFLLFQVLVMDALGCLLLNQIMI